MKSIIALIAVCMLACFIAPTESTQCLFESGCTANSCEHGTYCHFDHDGGTSQCKEAPQFIPTVVTPSMAPTHGHHSTPHHSTPHSAPVHHSTPQHNSPHSSHHNSHHDELMTDEPTEEPTEESTLEPTLEPTEDSTIDNVTNATVI